MDYIAKDTTSENDFKSGFVCILGEPNVGKSTLLNRLLGEKIAIVTQKPQTTRNTITGIITTGRSQIVILDTPGILKPKRKLDNALLKSAETAADGVDCILYLITDKASYDDNIGIISRFSKNTPVILVINKSDVMEKQRILPIIERYGNAFDFADIIPISALTGDNCDALIEAVLKRLKPGPKYFPDDMITSEPERRITAEIIREKALLLLDEELPHGVAVEITQFKKRPDKDILDIDATLYCEKESHKGIIIGKNGDMLKNISSRARRDIELLLGQKVFLQTWVKVKSNWRDSDFYIKSFGYKN